MQPSSTYIALNRATFGPTRQKSACLTRLAWHCTTQSGPGIEIDMVA